MTAAPTEQISAGRRHRFLDRLRTALLTPIRAMRLRYLPLLMIYYAYGALGLVAIAEAFWVKDALTFTPAQLAAIAVWLTLPWTIKMVFGQLADSVPIMGSQRRAYVFIGASLVASGLVILAGAAGGWITIASKNTLYVAAQLMIVIGVVLQDVIADAMTTEVVDRVYPDGTPRPKAEVERELGLLKQRTGLHHAAAGGAAVENVPAGRQPDGPAIERGFRAAGRRLPPVIGAERRDLRLVAGALDLDSLLRGLVQLHQALEIRPLLAKARTSHRRQPPAPSAWRAPPSSQSSRASAASASTSCRSSRSFSGHRSTRCCAERPCMSI